MLFRDEGGDAVVAIPQPGHAWLAGQLVRAWGNDAFTPPAPLEEVCLGAEQHDLAWLAWEAAPTLNPATGRPHRFHEVPTARRVADWQAGVRPAPAAYGRYPALLVSLHADAICRGVAEDVRHPGAPPRAGAERVGLRLSSPRGDPEELVLEPWPFGAGRV